MIKKQIKEEIEKKQGQINVLKRICEFSYKKEIEGLKTHVLKLEYLLTTTPDSKEYVIVDGSKIYHDRLVVETETPSKC